MNSQLSDEALDRRQSPIDMDPALFREAGYQLVNDIAGLLSSIRNYPVTTSPTPRSLQAKLPETIPVTGMAPLSLLKESWQLLVNNSLFNSHPGFWGYITSSPAPI